MEEAEPRFDEVLEVMIKAWTSDTPWSHRGQYWQFDNIVVEPPTVQKPHPPIWMGAGSPGSIKKVAANGFNLLLGQFSSLAQIAEQIALFKSEVEAQGRTFDPMTVGVARSLNVVMNAAEYEKAIENRMAGRRRVERLSQRPDAPKKPMSEDEVREVAEAGTLYGTPDDIAVKLQALRDVGAAYVLINSAGGPASLRRFAREVMPAFLG
jgi:alkanesulfonate monooxygenase SsuD/methylene tetrahydromethanopterin reductase-like flavin-dependent oxidoreductase (luciferase family)